MRTNVFDRTWETKLRPINSLAGLFVVGNDTSANRVDSIIPDARITEQFGLIGRKNPVDAYIRQNAYGQVSYGP